LGTKRRPSDSQSQEASDGPDNGYSEGRLPRRSGRGLFCLVDGVYHNPCEEFWQLEFLATFAKISYVHCRTCEPRCQICAKHIGEQVREVATLAFEEGTVVDCVTGNAQMFQNREGEVQAVRMRNLIVAQCPLGRSGSNYRFLC
jgi:hypothetical protein